MRLPVTALLWTLAAFSVLPLQAQILGPLVLRPDAAPGARGVALDDPTPIHVSDDLLAHAYTRRAIEGWQQAEPLGAGKTAPVYTVGDTAVFKVRHLARQDTVERPVFVEVTFVLKREAERFRLWVEVAELENGNVLETDLDALYRALDEATPPGSINPAAGIIVNNEAVFGEPPVVQPGDVKTDVLLSDIQDDWSPGRGFVAGFVDPLDVFTDEANARAILYLDSMPGLFSPSTGRRGTQGIEETAAHEYQHLIHLNYDPNEITFVNEGLSEWASLINGYTPRPITYLSNPASYNVPLFRWSAGFETAVIHDYQRAGLFTTYVAERIGVEATGSITRRTPNGFDGYASVLSEFGLGVEETIFDFHTANLLNDPSLPPFRYTTEAYRTLRAQPVAVTDGRTESETPRTEISVEAGAVTYLSWRQVRDFRVVIDVLVDDESDAAAVIARRDRIRVRAVLYRDGALTTETFRPTLDTVAFAGAYDRIDLAVTNTDPRPSESEQPLGVRLFYRADWETDQALETRQVVYDTGSVAEIQNDMGDTTGAFFTVGAEAIQVNRFAVPPGARLAQVSVAPYYESQFQNSTLPPDAPTNFQLIVWAPGDEGLVGERILTLDLDDPRSNSGLELNFLDVDLQPYAAQLSALPDTIYIGLTNTGEDENHLVLAASPLTVAGNVSFLSLPSFSTTAEPAFRAFPDASPRLAETVVPIRATFALQTGVAVETDPELPQTPSLEPNYPNPFNPATTVTYYLPEATDVRLAVYDVLGRRVALLVDDRRPPGRHAVTLDASTWASGTYLYTLEAGGRRLSRTMVLVK